MTGVAGSASTAGTIGRTPRERIEAQCARRGRTAVAAGCVRLFRGDSSDDVLLEALGPPTRTMRDGSSRADDAAWFRTWALRGLLWSYDGSAAADQALLDGCGDEAWRVREMASKVVARHLVGDAFDAVTALRIDPVDRVARAAERAMARLTAAQR